MLTIILLPFVQTSSTICLNGLQIAILRKYKWEHETKNPREHPLMYKPLMIPISWSFVLVNYFAGELLPKKPHHHLNYCVVVICKAKSKISTWVLFRSQVVAWPKTSEDMLEESGAWSHQGEPQALWNTDEDGYLQFQKENYTT